MKPVQLSTSHTVQHSLSHWWNVMLAALIFFALFFIGWLYLSTSKLMLYSIGNSTHEQSQSENLLSSAKFLEEQTLAAIQTTAQTVSSPSQLQLPAQEDDPPFSPFIHVVPIDGTSLLVNAFSPELSNQIYLSSKFMAGTHYIDAFTEMTYSNTVGSYVGVIEGLMAQTATDGKFSVSSAPDDSPDIDFQQTYVPKNAPEVSIVPFDRNLELSIVNTNTFPVDVYITVVDSIIPKNFLPSQYRLLSKGYSIRASDAISQSNQIMLLTMSYDPQIFDDLDPYSLSIIAWNPTTRQWHEVESSVFIEENFVAASVTELTMYALVSTYRWRDTFEVLDRMDFGNTADNINAQTFDAGQELLLISRPGTGSIQSMPITPPSEFDVWGELTFDANVTSNLSATLLSIDIMSDTETVLLADVASGTNLATLIDPQKYRTLRLRVNLTSTTEAAMATLSSWQLSWIPEVPLGDVNCDTAVSSVDALFVLQYTIKSRADKANCLPAHRELYIPRCDVNNDEQCTGIDALFILQCDVGIANALCPADNGSSEAEER